MPVPEPPPVMDMECDDWSDLGGGELGPFPLLMVGVFSLPHLHSLPHEPGTVGKQEGERERCRVKQHIFVATGFQHFLGLNGTPRYKIYTNGDLLAETGMEI